MPSGDEIRQYLTGAWRLLMGRADGMELLDLSADGFWNSFFAMVLALPPLIVSWVAIAIAYDAVGIDMGSKFSLLVRLGLVDFGAWVLPLVPLALAAPSVGIGDRLVHYVVATNWASAIIAWLTLPISLLRVAAPAAEGLTALVWLVFFVCTMALNWRLTNAVFGKGPAFATAVFVGMFAVSLAILFALQSTLGVVAPDQVPA